MSKSTSLWMNEDKRTDAPAGPGDPGVPASPLGPCAPSDPRAPVGPASPWQDTTDRSLTDSTEMKIRLCVEYMTCDQLCMKNSKTAVQESGMLDFMGFYFVHANWIKSHKLSESILEKIKWAIK